MDDKDQVNMAQAVKRLKENLPAFLDYERVNAQITRAKFIALVDQGFSEQQALELCKK